MAKQETVLKVDGDVMIIEKTISSNFVKIDSSSKIDFIKSNVYFLLVKETAQITAPTELTPGIDYLFFFKQDAVGNHNITFDSKFIFGADDNLSIGLTANQVSILTCISDGENLYCGSIKQY